METKNEEIMRHLKTRITAMEREIELLRTELDERKDAQTHMKAATAAAEAAMRAKIEFLANVSHEIRTPLNGIIGMYNLLLSTPLDTEQTDFALTGKRSADGLLSILNDILDFSKIEAGKLGLECIDFDLRVTMEELVELPAMLAHQKGLDFNCRIHHDVPALLQGDPGRLRQVILNLTGNAVKFTDTGEVVLSAEVQEETRRHAKIRFAVRDTGIGISSEEQHLLFNSFHQVDASITRKYGGTGLGLAICKQLVAMMGGDIGVQSEPGGGSTFWFTACFRKQPPIEAEQPRNQQPIQGKRILVVDDNRTNLDIMHAHLTGWGCICDTAQEGRTAIVLLRAAAEGGIPYAALITDMRMPGMSGAELGRHIKRDPLLNQTKMVMLTSQGLRGEAAGVQSIGFAAYLTKPVRGAQLFDCLVAVLNGRPEKREEKKIHLITRHSLAEERKRQVRILLVEDNSINRKVALHLLEKFGFQAVAVGNGREALQALSTENYDVVLMDLQMPEMDGFETTRAIRGARAGNRRIPIIAMTAHALPGDRERCLAKGMSDYLTKPIQPEELLSVITRHMTRREHPPARQTVSG